MTERERDAAMRAAENAIKWDDGSYDAARRAAIEECIEAVEKVHAMNADTDWTRVGSAQALSALRALLGRDEKEARDADAD